jgi:hypothetical protein
LGDKLKEVVSVKDFGAVGDGVSDDTAAIQAAIDAVETAGGGTVFLPQGVYKVTSTLTTSASEVAIKILGSGSLFTTQGTVLAWRGGNNMTVVAMPGYGILSDLFVRNANSATGVTAVSFAGTSAPDNRAYGSCINVITSGFSVGFLVDWAWNINFWNTKALTCTVGYDMRTEANACTFTGCYAGKCGIGITDDNSSGVRGLVWTGGSIEGSTVAGIKYDAANVSNSWQFNGTYFEGNYVTAKLAKNVSLTEPFINGDGGGGAREPIVISGSRGIRIENAYSANGVTSLVDFIGADAAYEGNTVFITESYPNSTLAKSVYDHPDTFQLGWLDPSCYVQIETEWLDAASAQLVPISIVGENSSLRARLLVGASLVVQTEIVVSGTATFGAGRTGPTFTNIVSTTFNANIPIGVHPLTLVGSAPATWFSNTFTYRASGTAETSGSYKFVLFFV